MNNIMIINRISHSSDIQEYRLKEKEAKEKIAEIEKLEERFGIGCSPVIESAVRRFVFKPKSGIF